MYRFFISRESFAGQTVTLGQEFAHRLGRVLRLHTGDRVVFLDNSGWEYDAELIQLDHTRVEARITGKRLSEAEPSIRLHLYQALLKLDKFELVLQKGVELGIAGFTPLISLRSVASAPQPDRYSRWQRIILEAAEQSRRGKLPPLNPAMSLEAALAVSPGQRLIPWEGEDTIGLRQALGSPRSNALQHPPEISLFIGPEGGWDGEEVSEARRQGAVTVSLGPRILRAETAGLVAAAAILYHYGGLGG